MKNKKILVVAAHPDDELLGCGGSLKKLSKDKCNILFIFVIYKTVTNFLCKHLYK